MEQMSIFENQIERPLAERLRPKNLEEYVGQSHLLGKGKILRRLIEGDNISSMIFWGPPGVGYYSGQDHSGSDKGRVHRLFCRDQRYKGNTGCNAAGRN